MLFLIISYDISDVRLQAKIRNFLRRYLRRVQNSVFNGEVTPSQKFEILEFLSGLQIPDTDSVLIYTIKIQSKVEVEFFGQAIDDKPNIIT